MLSLTIPTMGIITFLRQGSSTARRGNISCQNLFVTRIAKSSITRCSFFFASLNYIVDNFCVLFLIIIMTVWRFIIFEVYPKYVTYVVYWRFLVLHG